MEPNKQGRMIGGRLDSSLVEPTGAPHHGDLGCDGPTIEIKKKQEKPNILEKNGRRGGHRVFGGRLAPPWAVGGI